ncbi:MAG: hypothetical protein RMJ45_00765, partial [Candidatus Calescibacterium sp.]|nr:hypothetical protein [Candidatus Calescibacterium sp.]
ITKTWLYQEGKQKGLEEGIQKGRKEGLKEALLFAIRIKFGKISRSIKKEIIHIDDVDKLRLLKKEVIKARTLKEFEKKIKSVNHSS